MSVTPAAGGPIADLVPVRRALLTVFDKTGLVDLGRDLAARGVEILSTGGTAKALRDAGIPVVDVSDVTGFPEVFDGRVKTLHPKIHGGLLFRREVPAHVAGAEALGIGAIDLLVVNLYPFEKAAATPGAPEGDVIEMIDIGGPAMVRAASKNFASVTVVTSASDVPALSAELDARGGATSLAFRRDMAGRAFMRTAAYDAAIATWMNRDPFPARLTLTAERAEVLRYGENPHQQGALYRLPDTGEASVAHAKQHSGKELSYNNILDASAALDVARFLMYPCAVVIKHKNPCGAATHPTDLLDAFRRAHAGDPLSAFGGIVAFNRPVTEAVAEAMATADKFFEVVIAPGYEGRAIDILTSRTKWGKNVRILETHAAMEGREPVRGILDVRTVSGGLLVQDRDASIETEFKVVTRREPTKDEWRDLRFAWELCRHVTSNAICFAKDSTLIGCGAGQMSRVDSVMIAARKAGEKAKGAVMASDAFFPFADGILAAADAGVTAVVHPGGSIRDAEVIAACDARGLSLVTTGFRHFRH